MGSSRSRIGASDEGVGTKDSDRRLGRHDAPLERIHHFPRQDSWVDAVVTLLATVIFGLGWTLVELERADPAGNRYDAVASEMWMAAVVTSVDARANDAIGPIPIETWNDEDAAWTEAAQQRSNR